MSGSGLARRTRWARFVPAGYSGLLALLIAGPLLGPGYLLLRDAVSTPRSYLTDSALGLGAAAPRAVPQDALLAALSPLIDGGSIVKAILLVALWAAGFGAAVLSRELLRVSTGPQLVAVTVAMWNPYVAERLLQGHWSLLTGYAALPWTALAAYRIRCSVNPDAASRKKPPLEPTAEAAPSRSGKSAARSSAVSSWAALAGCFAAAGLTPTGALLAGCTAMVLVGRRNLLGALALLLATSAPWLTATALSGAGSEPSDPAGIAAFAARAEPALGTLGSLAGLGGIWNADSVPDSRTTPLSLIATAILLTLVAIGIRTTAGIKTGATNGHTADRSTPSTSTALADESDTATTRSPASAAETSGDTGTCRLDAVESDIGDASSNREAAETSSVDATPVGDATNSTHPEAATIAASTTGNDATAAGDSATTSGIDRESLRVGRALLTLAALAVLLPALGATSWGMSGLEWLVGHVPGAGLLRDTQKYVALAMPAYVLCAAAGCRAVAVRFAAHSAAPKESARPPGMALAATVFIALLVLPLFDLAWGVGGALKPVHYPVGWQRVAERIDGPGDVAVLPGGMFRKFPYSGRVAVLDPAPRMLPRDVLQTGELPVHGRTVAGEGTRAREVETALLHGDSARRLGELGVGWVLVERTTPGPLGESKTTLAQLDSVYADSQLALYRVPDATDHFEESQSAHRVIACAAHILWAALLVGGLLLAAILRPRC
ncbi:hypothetical protein OIE68_34000 [Nocardia vinacea]|uniref:hypothetical protein n=1 Tax=Nocardia vinacea TaxID=96468 RepID=UPI002E12061F|nr:hypothetical protein OIE68_34000 [Nocardia vinacea]